MLIKTETPETKYEGLLEAKSLFNRYGIVSDEELLFSRTIFDSKSPEFFKMLRDAGFVGEMEIAGNFLPQCSNVYALFNPKIYTRRQALDWLDEKYRYFSYDI